MPLPWLQIVRLMPSILDVSRELLKRARRTPVEPQDGSDNFPVVATPEARISALEENERRQAELVTSMADQLAQLTAAVTLLHRQVRWLLTGFVITVAIAGVALVVALR